MLLCLNLQNKCSFISTSFMPHNMAMHKQCYVRKRISVVVNKSVIIIVVILFVFFRVASKILVINFKIPAITSGNYAEDLEIKKVFRLAEKASPLMLVEVPKMLHKFKNLSSQQRYAYKDLVPNIPMHDRLRSAYGNLAFFIEQVCTTMTGDVIIVIITIGLHCD